MIIYKKNSGCMGCIQPFALVATLWGGAALASEPADFPNHPIRLVVPNAPGGGTDTTARFLSQKLREAWNQPLVVVNQPGGNSAVGTEAVAKATADGYTLLLTTSIFVTIPLFQSVQSDPIKDFTAIAPINRAYTVIAAYPGIQASKVKELVALAKSNPDALNYATANAG